MMTSMVLLQSIPEPRHDHHERDGRSVASAPSGRHQRVAALVASLLLGACAPGGSDDGDDGSEGATEAPTSTGAADTGAADTDGAVTGETGVADSSGDDEGSEGGDPPPGSCNDPQDVPAAPVDCSGADGVIADHVFIEPGGADPSILEGVRRVEGSLRINRIALADLDFMACVQEVTGDVTIYGNEQLTSVDGLFGLTSIGTDFVFSDNDAITDFDGLPNVVTIPRNLVIKNNASLEAVTGFHQLEEVGDNLLIQQNDALRHINGLGGLHTLGGVLGITANGQLCISSVNCVGVGITDPATPPPEWSTQANDFGC